MPPPRHCVILAMGALTRLDCARGSAGLIRQALSRSLSLALLMQASGRSRQSPQAVFDAFCDSRLAGHNDVFGMLQARHDLDALTARAAPTES